MKQVGCYAMLAAAHDGQTFKVYIDGALSGVSDKKMSGVVPPGHGVISIGSKFGYSPAQGIFSDVKLYTRALGDAEIMNASGDE